MSGRSGMFGDWKAWEEVLSARGFTQRLDTEVDRANQRIGLDAVAAIRRSIRSGDYEPNSALTVAIKGSSKPLVDTGDLNRRITHDVEKGRRAVWVGLKRNEGKTSVAEKLHDGFVIDLEAHPGIRQAVFAKLREKGRMFRPGNQLASGSKRWVVPPRPFITGPLAGPEMQAKIRQHYHEAFGRALRNARGAA